MRILLQIFILCSCLVHLDQLQAAELSESAKLVTEMCRFYLGDDISNYVSAGQFQNPLAASPTGRKIMDRNFKEAYVSYNYFSQDEMVKHFVEDPDYSAALRECYGANETAKMNFTFFLSSIEFQGKSNAALLEAATWTIEGAGFLKVATWLAARYRLVKSALRLVTIASTAFGTLIAGQVAFNFVQYKRGKLKRVELKLNPQLTQTAKRDLEDSQKNAFGALEDLRLELENLKQNIKDEQDPTEKAKLIILKEETQKLLKQLTEQLQT